MYVYIARIAQKYKLFIAKPGRKEHPLQSNRPCLSVPVVVTVKMDLFLSDHFLFNFSIVLREKSKRYLYLIFSIIRFLQS